MEQIPALRNETEALSRGLEELYRGLMHFKHEGKMHRKKNFDALKELVEKLFNLITRHKKLQEKVIFKFFQNNMCVHLEAISFLEAEHDDILKTIYCLQTCVKKSRIPASMEDYIFEVGMYLVALLRHHFGLEKKLYAWTKCEMTSRNRQFLMQKIEEWIKKSARKKTINRQHRTHCYMHAVL